MCVCVCVCVCSVGCCSGLELICSFMVSAFDGFGPRLLLSWRSFAIVSARVALGKPSLWGSCLRLSNNKSKCVLWPFKFSVLKLNRANLHWGYGGFFRAHRPQATGEPRRIQVRPRWASPMCSAAGFCFARVCSVASVAGVFFRDACGSACARAGAAKVRPLLSAACWPAISFCVAAIRDTERERICEMCNGLSRCTVCMHLLLS